MALSSIVNSIWNGTYPEAEDGLEALQTLGLAPTCGAMVVWAMVDKAIHGDVAAAKLLKESLGEETAMHPSKNDFEKMSDMELLSLLSDSKDESNGE